MAQFDVFANPGARRSLIPFVVSPQSGLYERAGTRFVAALVARSAVPIEAHWLAPHFIVVGHDVVLDVFNLVTLPASRLGAPVATLANEDDRVKLIRALDEFISQA